METPPYGTFAPGRFKGLAKKLCTQGLTHREGDELCMMIGSLLPVPAPIGIMPPPRNHRGEPGTDGGQRTA